MGQQIASIAGSNPSRRVDRCRRYAFITPRFGEEIVGGAETLIGNLAGRLANRGDLVEVFTTCARDNRTWENSFRPGLESCYGVPVYRFPVDSRDLESWIPKQIAISEGMALSVDDQLEWMEHSVNSSALYAHIASVASDFDALFFGPYLFGTTFWGSQISPQNSYLIPCIHDEHYAYTDVIRSMLRNVAGAVCNSYPEMELLQSLAGSIRCGEVGMGFVPFQNDEIGDLEPFFEEPFPYLLYLGRKETGKGAHLLIDSFLSARSSEAIPNDAKLVIVGGGDFSDLERPNALQDGSIIDLCQVSERDKRRLLKYATALVQPSRNESFSIVLMEAWLLGTPVVVDAHCPVTRYQVTQSGGGLYYSDEQDFAGVVCELFSSPELRNTLAQSGKRFVSEYYDWDVVLDRFDAVMSRSFYE